MVEVTIAAAIVSAVLAGAVGYMARGAKKPDVVEVLVPEDRLAFPEEKRIVLAPDPEHEHQPVSVSRMGWRCYCGLHFHRFVKGVCACGKTGDVDGWAEVAGG